MRTATTYRLYVAPRRTLRATLHSVAMLGLLCVCFHSSRVQAADDLWWAKDKQKHLLVSSGAAFATYIWLGHSGLESTSRAGVAALVVLGVGALKEARDALGYGHASWKDMTWNVIGTAVGLVVAWAVERWLWPRSVSPPRGGWRESNTAP